MVIAPALKKKVSNFVYRAQFNSKKTRSQPTGSFLQLYTCDTQINLLSNISPLAGPLKIPILNRNVPASKRMSNSIC